MNRRVVRDTLTVVWLALWGLALLWVAVRVVRHAWGRPLAPLPAPITMYVRVEKPEQVRPTVEALLPPLEGYRR